MKLLTKYSVANLMVMVTIFIATALLLNKFIHVILVREMDADLTGVQKKVDDYVKQHNTFPTGYALDEEEISFVPTGNRKIKRNSELTQMFSKRENKLHNFMKLDFPLQFHGNWYKVTLAKPVEGMHHLSRALIDIFVAGILLIILISVLLNNFLLRKLWRPFFDSMNIMRNFKLKGSRYA